MPEPRPIPLDIPPGIVKTEGVRASEGRYVDAQWVRFRNGKAEKRGGFSAQTSARGIFSSKFRSKTIFSPS